MLTRSYMHNIHLHLVTLDYTQRVRSIVRLSPSTFPHFTTQPRENQEDNGSVYLICDRLTIVIVYTYAFCHFCHAKNCRYREKVLYMKAIWIFTIWNFRIGIASRSSVERVRIYIRQGSSTALKPTEYQLCGRRVGNVNWRLSNPRFASCSL